MAKQCKITVQWLNGDVQEFIGSLHTDNKLLWIWPADNPGKSITIPLVCIHHCTTEG